MPLPMVHLGVAQAIAAQRPISNLPAFYLGSIAPDAVHMRSNFCPEDKKRSHYFVKDSAQPGELQALQDLIAQNTPHRDFYLGYLVHLLTDRYWQDTVYQIYLERHRADPAPLQDQRWAYYNDTDRLDFELYQTVPWREAVWTHLEQASATAIDGVVAANEVALWQKRTLHWYESGQSEHTNPIRYLTCRELENFIADTARKIAEVLNTLPGEC